MEQNNEIEEQELIAQYKASGNQELIGAIYKPYMQLVYGVSLKYLKNQQDAQDAVMGIYELVSKKIMSHDVKAFRPWLYVVSKNYCFDQLRKKSNRFEKEKTAELMYSDDVFHPNDTKETELSKLENCLERLDVEQMNCVKAFYYKQKSYQIISDEMEISWNRVRSLIQNGRRMLKNCMDK